MYGGLEFDMCVEAYDKLIQLITLVVIQSARHPAFQFGVVVKSLTFQGIALTCQRVYHPSNIRTS